MTGFNLAEELAPRMTADGLMALADVERRIGERRQAPPNGTRRANPGRRAIDRMRATPAEMDRLARQAAVQRLGWEEYYDEDFANEGGES